MLVEDRVTDRQLQHGTPTGAARSRRWDFRSFSSRRKLFLFGLCIPAVSYVVVVALFPLAQGIWYSFFNYSLMRPDRYSFVGLENYAQLFADPAAFTTIVNTFIFTIGALFFEFVLGLVLALAMWRDNRFNKIALALILVPISITPVAAGLVFRALLTPDFGLIGYWAAALDISSPRGFLGDPATAMAGVILIDIWQWTPLVALILLAGLKCLPADVLEAAAVDGATPVQRFRLIVFPLLLPAVFLGLVLRMMDAFRVFDIIFAATGGGPGNATEVLMVYAVKQGLQFFNIGYGSAVSNLMIVCIALLAAIFTLVFRRADKRINS